MRKIIPMTQEIFDSIMDRRDEIGGEEVDEIAWQVMLKYPDFLEVNARRMCEELGIDFDMELPEESSEETKQSYEEFLQLVEEQKKSGKWKKKKKTRQYVL